ncbi:MAG: type II toxin-antitoxin system VapC family toxin [Armatimonadetes bacterium]|nr:type II toxin-antitoxin system VapC family toxin [Armatimonadota bacterium]
MKEVFVDTSGFYAFLDADDRHHNESRDLFRQSQTEDWSLVTTNYVVHETWALIQARLGWTALDIWRDDLVVSCDVVWVSQLIHALGEARCRQARERRLSLTDCVSFEIMRRRGIRDAIAWDEHFVRQGFGLPR